MAQSLHCNVKACLVLKEEGAKEGDDYFLTMLAAAVLPAIVGPIVGGIVDKVGLFTIH